MAMHPTPTVHYFREVNPGKFSSVKHFELYKVENGTSLLSEKINLSNDRQCARSSPDYWLKIREDSKWSKPVTGLFKTSIENIYYGDCNFKRHLIILKFSTDKSRLTVYFFRNFYTTDLKQVLTSIQHPAPKIKKRGA